MIRGGANIVDEIQGSLFLFFCFFLLFFCCFSAVFPLFFFFFPFSFFCLTRLKRGERLRKLFACFVDSLNCGDAIRRTDNTRSGGRQGLENGEEGAEGRLQQLKSNCH